MEDVMGKRAVNLTIDGELLDEAKRLGTNLSALTEVSLRRHLSDVRAKQWKEENKAAFAAGTAEFEKNGPWYTPDWLDS
jgi:antitoxin CcdA